MDEIQFILPIGKYPNLLEIRRIRFKEEPHQVGDGSSVEDEKGRQDSKTSISIYAQAAFHSYAFSRSGRDENNMTGGEFGLLKPLENMSMALLRLRSIFSQQRSGLVISSDVYAFSIMWFMLHCSRDWCDIYDRAHSGVELLESIGARSIAKTQNRSAMFWRPPILLVYSNPKGAQDNRQHWGSVHIILTIVLNTDIWFW